MSKIDDLFDKKKDEAPMLDLSKTVINTAEEYRAVLDKVPDFKTRPEKVTDVLFSLIQYRSANTQLFTNTT